MGKGADSEESDQYPAYREIDRERLELRAQALLDIIHRPPRYLPVIVDFPELHGQQAFRILRRHAKKRGQPHPKQRARPAYLNRGGNADNIPRSDRGRQSCSQRAKARHVAFAVIFRREYQLERQRQTEDLQQSEPNRQEDPGSYQ